MDLFVYKLLKIKLVVFSGLLEFVEDMLVLLWVVCFGFREIEFVGQREYEVVITNFFLDLS